MLLKLLFSVIIFEVTVSTSEETVNRIYHGQPATRGQFPWHAGLIIEKNGPKGRVSGYCGGAVIGRSWVLTAAHCVNGSDVFEIKVWLASVARPEQNDPNRVKLVSKQWIIFEGFKNLDYYGLVGDIALVKLPKRLVYNEYIQPIRLASTEVPLNTSVSFSGWGDTGLGEGVGHIDLKHTSLFINTCPRPHHGYICAFPYQKNQAQAACAADSGGPLVLQQKRPIHVGVLSTGVVGCPKGGHNKFASTAYYRQWIRKHTGI